MRSDLVPSRHGPRDALGVAGATAGCRRTMLAGGPDDGRAPGRRPASLERYCRRPPRAGSPTRPPTRRDRAPGARPSARQGRRDRSQLPRACRRRGRDPPPAPLVFSKWPSSVIGDGAEIRWDPELTAQVDYEAELAVVIGRTAVGSASADALDHVLGYTCLNDVSARDLQFGDGQWARGKSLDTFCPMGPAWSRPTRSPTRRTSTSAAPSVASVVQSANTSQMYFGVAAIISYCSQSFSLEPGDVIATGTPGGVGVFRDPPRFLADGDECPSRSSGSAPREHLPLTKRRRDRRMSAPPAATASASSSRARSAASAPGRSATSCATAPGRRLRPRARSAPPAADHDPDELDRIDFVTGDITDLPTVERALDEHGITNVIHLAALQVPFCRADPPRGAVVNVVGTVNVFEAVNVGEPAWRQVVYTSSIGDVFGRRRRPRHRPADGGRLCASRQPLRRLQAGQRRHRPASTGSTPGCRASALRPMTVYGVGRDQGMTSRPTKAIAAAVLGVPFADRSAVRRCTSTPRTWRRP